MMLRRSLQSHFLLIPLLLSACTTSGVQPPPTCECSLPISSPISIQRDTAPPTQSPAILVNTVVPSQTPIPGKRSSVVLISFDGAQVESVYDLMGQGDLPNFSSLVMGGIHAEAASPVDPPLSAPVQYSLATGSYPAHTGIVSNAFHVSSDSFYWYRQAAEEPSAPAEPVWVTASRAGLTSAAVFFAGASPSFPGQSADYTIAYGVRDAYSAVEKIKLQPAGELETHPTSYSPLLTGSFTVPQVTRLVVIVSDSIDDGVTGYDTVSISTWDGESWIRLRIGEWGDMILSSRLHAGASFLVEEISSTQVTLFHSDVYHNHASPQALLEALNEKFGFFLPGADPYALEHGWITEEDYLQMSERSSLWMAQVASWVYSTFQPDLMFTTLPGFDAAGHAFWLQNARQNGYTPERAAAFDSLYRRAAKNCDLSLGTLLDPIDLESTTVMLVSGHGMAPVHTTVYINTLLERGGLLVLDRDNRVVVNRTQAFAVAAGGAVNIYVNLSDREADGIVPPSDHERVTLRIIQLLSELKDPQTGELVFQRVLSRHELAHLGLDHPHSGDIFAQAIPGYNLDGWRGKNTVFEPSKIYGQHGYAATLPEMQSIFIAAGRGVKPSGELLALVKVIDLAPTIAYLLGFEPAFTVDGARIPYFTLR